MTNAKALIYCPNFTCQAQNAETHRFCQQCRAPLPRRYLWAVSESHNAVGELVSDRYWVKHPRIWLDTKPGLLPETSLEVPAPVIPYLRLFAYRLHVPQPYSWLEKTGTLKSNILLLEQAPIDLNRLGETLDGTVYDPCLPSLQDAWVGAAPLRQLHWFWQIAQLWQPFHREGVAATLLDLALLRVDGALIRVLELQPDQAGARQPDLAALGQTWSGLIPGTHPHLVDLIQGLCQHLIDGQIRTPQQLSDCLDRALQVAARSQQRQIQIVTLTDQGPTRQRNEDACYPASGLGLTITADAPGQQSGLALTIVCDGIGGHEGGNIASNLAIETMQSHLQNLPVAADSDQVMAELEQAIYTANDRISQRNDQERRHDRQRMGTTVVLGLVQDYQLYLAHIGDSRAYRISRTGCYQVTLDDDLASREVRLGYAFYRDTQQSNVSGSLIQALGMGKAMTLHPTVQRFLLDEDCVFLLCSDGLSDHDRVEEHWSTTIGPLLEGKTEIGATAHQLVEIANKYNGHDNVTVSLIYSRVLATAPLAEPLSAQILTAIDVQLSSQPVPDATLVTQPAHPIPFVEPETRKRRGRLWLLMVVLFGLGLASWISYRLIVNGNPSIHRPAGFNPNPFPSASTSPLPSDPPPAPVSLAIGSFIQIGQVENPATTQPLLLLRQPPATLASTTPRPSPTPRSSPELGLPLPAGTVLRVVSRQEIPQQGYWLKVNVCRLSASPGADAVRTGWVAESALATVAEQLTDPTPADVAACAVPSASPTPTTSSPSP